MIHKMLCASLSGLLLGLAPQAQAQDRADPAKTFDLGKVQVNAKIRGDRSGYATKAHYHKKDVDLGPLGKQMILSTPFSVNVVPEQLIVNQQAQTVNDVLRNLPSVQIRDQQGLEVSRPQSRGFQGTIVQNTRLDGLNIIGTTAIPAENLGGIEVLNGLAGSLYGPATPAGVFNYVLKRPTDQPLLRVIESFDSRSIFTEQVDAGGRFGPSDKLGYRLDVVHGEGESYADGSNTNRTLFSGALDYHFDSQTVLETNFSHYETNVTGLPGSIVYDSGKSTVLPRAVSPTRTGLGQPGAGTDLITNTGLIKLKHNFDQDWSLEIGGLYQNAVRHLYGITHAFTDDAGDYKTTKNFNAVPRFTVASNSLQLNGNVDLFGMENNLSFGTNGFDNKRYSSFNSLAVTLGSANINHPVIYPSKPTPSTGGQYESGSDVQQSIIVGDMLHLNEQWAVQGVLNNSYLRSKSFDANGRVTSSDTKNGMFSPTFSVIYKPTAQLSTYATYARSIEQGESAPAGTVNANEFLAPYHDTEYEIGAKYAVTPAMLVTLAAFRMTRPLANTDASSNIFAVVGTQRNDGAEFFVQGDVNSQLSVLGGVTYINARLRNTGVAATNDKLVVGVPRLKGDISVDYHPAFANGYALTGTVHSESRRAATNTNNSFAPGYATLNLGARYSSPWSTHFVTLRLQMINVTGKNYYASVADGNIVGSPGANTAYYGEPRTFMASVELDL